MNREVLQRKMEWKALKTCYKVLQGEKVSAAVYDAAKFVLAKTVWKEQMPSTVHVHLSAQTIEEAKRRAGLLPPVIDIEPQSLPPVPE